MFDCSNNGIFGMIQMLENNSILLSIGNLALLYCHTLSQMVWVCVLLGASNGMYLTMDTSLAVDTLDVGDPSNVEEQKTNKEINELEANTNDSSCTNLNEEKNEPSTNNDNDHGAAQLLGIWGVFGFVGSALGPLIGGTALLLLGHIPNSQMSPSTSATTNAATTLSSHDAYHYYNYTTHSTEATVATTTTATTGSGTVSIDTLPTTPFYKFQGYEALFCLSAFYFFCSAVSLAFVRKKGV